MIRNRIGEAGDLAAEREKRLREEAAFEKRRLAELSSRGVPVRPMPAGQAGANQTGEGLS